MIARGLQKTGPAAVASRGDTAEALHHARQAFGAYRATLADLDRDLKACTSEYVAEWEGESVPLVALAAVLLAEAFPAMEPALVEQVALGALCCDHSAHLLDDLADKRLFSRRSGPLVSHAASILLSRGTAAYMVAAGGDARFAEQWQTVLKEASEGERFLWRHRGAAMGFGDIDWRMTARRGGLIKGPAWCYAFRTGDLGSVSLLARGIDSVALGIQLADDLLDWRIDLRHRIYTYPLQLAAAARGSLKALQIERALAEDGVIGEVVSVATRHLREGARNFSSARAYQLGRLVESLVLDVEALRHIGVGEHRFPGLAPSRRATDPRLQH